MVFSGKYSNSESDVCWMLDSWWFCEFGSIYVCSMVINPSNHLWKSAWIDNKTFFFWFLHLKRTPFSVLHRSTPAFCCLSPPPLPRRHQSAMRNAVCWVLVSQISATLEFCHQRAWSLAMASCQVRCRWLIPHWDCHCHTDTHRWDMATDMAMDMVTDRSCRPVVCCQAPFALDRLLAWLIQLATVIHLAFAHHCWLHHTVWAVQSVWAHQSVMAAQSVLVAQLDWLRLHWVLHMAH